MHDRFVGWPGLWGVVGVLAVLANALWRLSPLAYRTMTGELDAWQWLVLATWLVVAAYAEGYRGFHRQFSPRVIARAYHLSRHPRPLHVALGPLYCMGLIHATRRRLITSWALTVGIVALVIVVGELDQPWRGIVDAGVVVGLALGTLSIVYYLALAARGQKLPVAADVPS
jgi:hypothetical protein